MDALLLGLKKRGLKICASTAVILLMGQEQGRCHRVQSGGDKFKFEFISIGYLNTEGSVVELGWADWGR
jgi:hypothetical protein